MKTEELQKIADQSNFSWIKIRRFDLSEYTSDTDALNGLSRHHKQETEFLIEKCRELALEILLLQKQLNLHSSIVNDGELQE